MKCIPHTSMPGFTLPPLQITVGTVGIWTVTPFLLFSVCYLYTAKKNLKSINCEVLTFSFKLKSITKVLGITPIFTQKFQI